ncbi:MAG: hypothetical protein R8G66_04420 [Cytophagales bacterium]|nr:hypothetical protein [Cytophagales bacterium]
MKAKYEKVSFEEGSSVTAFKTGGERFDAPWHFHPEFELTYIISSHGIRYVGNHISDFRAKSSTLLDQ